MSTTAICGSCKFEFSVSKDMKKMIKNDKKKLPAYLLVLCLTLIVNGLRIRIELGWVVTTLNIIKH